MPLGSSKAALKAAAEMYFGGYTYAVTEHLTPPRKSGPRRTIIPNIETRGLRPPFLLSKRKEGLTAGAPLYRGGLNRLKDARSRQNATHFRFPRAPLRGASRRP